MHKKLLKCLTSKCVVLLDTQADAIYPIFKNGQSSIMERARIEKWDIIVNEDLVRLKKIKIFLRDPIERFASGVHTVIEYQNISNIERYLQQVQCYERYDRHFMPQFYWLIHLFRYFKGTIEILPVSKLYDIVPERWSPPIKKLSDQRKNKIKLFPDDVKWKRIESSRTRRKFEIIK